MFQPIIAGTGIAGYTLLKSSMDTQIERMTRFPVQERDETYFRENIGKVTSAEDLIADRRLLSVALSRFGLQDDMNKPAFIQKILESGTENPDSMANRMPDRRYREMTEAFGFGNNQFSVLELSKPEHNSFKGFVTSVLRDERYWSDKNPLRDEELSTTIGPLRDLIKLVDEATTELRNSNAGLDLLGLDQSANSGLFDGARERIEDRLRFDVMANEDLRGVLASIIDTDGKYSQYGERIGGDYDLIQPKAFSDLSAEAQARVHDVAENEETYLFDKDGNLLSAEEIDDGATAYQYQLLDGAAQATAFRAVEQAVFTEDGILLGPAGANSYEYEFEDIRGDYQDKALLDGLQDFFEPYQFSFTRLGSERFLERLIDATIANSPVEESGVVSRDSLASDRFNEFVDEVLAGHRRQSFELLVGEQNNTLRVSLYAERRLPEMMAVDTSEDGKWYSILGDQPVRNIMQTVLGLPTQFGAIDIEDQLSTIKERASTRLGIDKPEDLAKPEKMAEIIRQYVVLSDLQSGASAGSAPGSTALMMLQTSSANRAF